MASGRCSGGGGWRRAVLGASEAAATDEAADNAPAEVVREVALEPASPTPRARPTSSTSRAPEPAAAAPRDAAGDDDSGDEILRAAAARWPLPPSDPRPAATSGDASRPPPPTATVCKPCAPDGASEDPRSHHATGGRAYEI